MILHLDIERTARSRGATNCEELDFSEELHNVFEFICRWSAASISLLFTMYKIHCHNHFRLYLIVS